MRLVLIHWLIGYWYSMKLIEAVLQDLRYAARILRKYPGFSLAIILTTALGIGANVTIFSVLNAVVLEPLPYKDPDRLVRLAESNLGQNQIESPVSVPNFQDWQRQQSSFEDVSALELATFNLTGRGEPQRVAAARITPNLVPMLGGAPTLGRAFVSGEDRVVLLSDALWQRQFGGDQSIVNQTIRLNNENYTVVGVMPAGFQFMGSRELWVPFIIDPQKEPWRADRTNRNLFVFGRLKSGVTLDQATSDMDLVGQRLEEQFPKSNTGWRVRVNSFYEWLVPKEVRAAMVGLFVAVSLLLLIACANVANLLLASATTRQQEMATRAALGASPARLIRQLLIESLLLSGFGGLLGLGLASVATELIASGKLQNLGRLSKAGINGTVLGFTVFITLFTGLIFGLAPAWWSTRVNLTDKLKEGSRSDGGSLPQRLRSALVVAEVTMAAVVLVGAGLLVNVLTRLQAVPLGLAPDNVFTMQISLPGSKYGQKEQRVDFFNQLLERLRTVPGVVDAAAVEQAPTSISTWNFEIMLEGGDAATSTTRSLAEAHAITPRYFQTMGIPLLQGQDFASPYRADQPLELMVSETFARRYWPNENALGKRFRAGQNNPFGTVVGVVGDVHRFNSQQSPAFYFPYGYIGMPGLLVMVRTAAQPETLAAALRAEVRQLDADQPVYNVRTMNEIIANATAQQRFQAFLTSLFAAVALLLVAIGIYSVVAYMVKQRRREIGVRMAVGASTHNILRMVILNGMRNVLIGLVLGLVVSLALTKLIGLETTAADIRVFLLVGLLLTGVAFIACYLPAWRATKIDPARALRSE
jgi:putative ABC transport system permease protein